MLTCPGLDGFSHLFVLFPTKRSSGLKEVVDFPFFVSAGYLIMTDDWFSEFVYEIVVDKKFLPSDVLDVMQQEPTALPAWDPMGSLASF